MRPNLRHGASQPLRYGYRGCRREDLCLLTPTQHSLPFYFRFKPKHKLMPWHNHQMLRHAITMALHDTLARWEPRPLLVDHNQLRRQWSPSTIVTPFLFSLFKNLCSLSLALSHNYRSNILLYKILCKRNFTVHKKKISYNKTLTCKINIHTIP